MISRETVLVLGAGASVPFGYPSGFELKKIVENNISDDGSTHLRQLLHLGHLPDHLNDFRKSLKRSGQLSIDAFLERRTEFLELGKHAIAQAVIPYENAAALFTTVNQRKGYVRWYEQLLAALGSSFDDLHSNQLKIITFNYDRSLEQFLYEALASSFGKGEAEVAAKMNLFQIHHFYGQLGDHPWQKSTHSRPYGSDASSDWIRICEARLRLIHERGSDELLAKTSEWLNSADLVLFLGFGYHPINMQRLGWKSSMKKDCVLFGTSLGLERAEEVAVEEICENLFSKEIYLFQEDVSTFLRRRVIWSDPGPRPSYSQLT